ncbi:hypothetical protein [Oryzobacter telluris]|uniref:hypothetical protein n=1 Tax=Oryzobacter telluris TaxID=3149179 RepID=UPI00370DB951
MTTRLEQQYPRVAAWLRTVPQGQQAELVRRLALHAARSAGLAVPDEGTDLVEWSAALDERGWTQDDDGDWSQAPSDFVRARAASAVRHAAGATSATNTDESLYESIAALGIDAVRAELGLAAP